MRKYMNWLGHHEFGHGHRPFIFDGKSPTDSGSVDHVDYWLERWIDCYSWLHEQARSGQIQVIFSCYEQLCDDAARFQAGLFEMLGLESVGGNDLQVRAPVLADVEPVDRSLANRAGGIYSELVALSLSKHP